MDPPRTDATVLEPATVASFGTLLRHYRLAADLTQDQLAERAGMSPQGLRALESGRRRAPYRHTTARLAQALGLSASETAALGAAVVRVHAPASGAASASERRDQGTVGTTSMPVRERTNLPVQLTSFIGREREQGEVRALLAAARLVTLTGAGGAGKTRLALAVAGEALHEHSGGVWLAELAPQADPAMVVQAVAQALGLQEEPQRPLLATLVDRLKEQRLLLVLDNCEHLVAACAELVVALLQACPRLRILATSRETLAVPGETTYCVPSLAVPDLAHLTGPDDLAGYAAVQLFLARARSRRPGFILSARSVRAVAEICARLDGMPLAIELAAARVGSLPVEAIAARLDDCFRLLTAGLRTVVPRHQTLRATLDWSYDLLSAGEQRLLGRLSVFARGCTLEAVEAVCGEEGAESEPPGGSDDLAKWEVPDLLGGLVNKSLALLTEGADAPHGAGRYRLLETVRQYGRERLGTGGEEEARVRDRHLEWCLALAEEAAPRLIGPEQGVWLDRLEAEHGNLRAALGWARERGMGELGLRLAGALSWFWWIRGYLSEGRGWLEAALADGQRCAPAARALALQGAASLALMQGEYERSATLHEEALALCRGLGDVRGSSLSLNGLGNAAIRQGDYGRAVTLYEEALADYRAVGDRLGICVSLRNLGDLACEQGDYGRAAAHLAEALALRRALEDRRCIASALSSLGALAYGQGDYGPAAALHEEAAALFRAAGDRWGLANSLNYLWMVAYGRGDDLRCGQLLEEAQALLRTLGDTAGIALVQHNLGLMAYRQGDRRRAAALIEEALALQRALGRTPRIALALDNLGRVACAQGDYTRAAAHSEESLALRRTLGDKRGIAASLGSLGRVAYAQADYERAAALQEEGLLLSCSVGARDAIAEGLEGLAWVAAALRQPYRAARLGGAAEAQREALDVPLLPEQRAGHGQAVRAMRAALGDEAFAAAWAAGRALPPEEAIALALETRTVAQPA